MAHKCYFCGKAMSDYDDIFSNKFQNKNGTWSYAHNECYELYEKADGYIEDLDMLKFKRQLQEYLKGGYTIEGIGKILDYWYDVTGHTSEKANGGIGIVPHISREAHEWYAKHDRIEKSASSVSQEDKDAYRMLNEMKPRVSTERGKFKKPKGITYFKIT